MYIKQKSFTYRCETEHAMEDARNEAISKNPGYAIIKEKKDYKTKKSKGEIVDEYWLYTVTFDIQDDQ